MMDYAIIRMAPDSLEHHGIKGQKWGVRRYENADGTLTEAGKKRYQKDFYKTVKREAKAAVKTKLGEGNYGDEFTTMRLRKYIPNDKVKEFAPLIKKMNDNLNAEYSLKYKQGNTQRKENRSATDVEKKELRAVEARSHASEKAKKEYARKVADDLLGKYGTKKVAANKLFGITFKDEARKIVESALEVAAIDEAYK